MNFFGKNSSLIVHKEMPFNAETPLELITKSCITPEEVFFVRNHGSIPEIDAEQYRLRVTGMVRRTLSLSLDEISKFSSKTISATLQCAGNRRSEFSLFAPVKGEINWNAGAIGNAQWTGVPLDAILDAAGIDPESAHVAFSGLDVVDHPDSDSRFGVSIPISKAMSGEVLLSYRMNGKPLPIIHGFPLRVLVPGYIGARSVKWLGEISVRDRASENYFQANAYKIFPPDIRAETADWATGLSLGNMAVNAVVTRPLQRATLKSGRFLVQGYAIAGSRPIERVELSFDEGRTWTSAELRGSPDPWSWRFWEREVNLDPGFVRISVRAWDDAGQTQPEDPGGIWNFKGYANNAWHRISITVRSV
jgi:sulfite oxidase